MKITKQFYKVCCHCRGVVFPFIWQESTLLLYHRLLKICIHVYSLAYNQLQIESSFSSGEAEDGWLYALQNMWKFLINQWYNIRVLFLPNLFYQIITQMNALHLNALSYLFRTRKICIWTYFLKQYVFSCYQ